MRLRVKINAKEAARTVRAHVVSRMHAIGNDIGAILVSQSVTRIHQSGDDEITYPDLWAKGVPGHYRRDGTPLLDTGALVASLTYAVREHERGLTVVWGSPLDYAKKQHEGFTNPGPNVIPVTRRAATIFKTSPDAKESPTRYGLKGGKDYIYVRGDTHVPARPIVRMSAENRRELTETLKMIGD